MNWLVHDCISIIFFIIEISGEYISFSNSRIITWLPTLLFVTTTAKNTSNRTAITGTCHGEHCALWYVLTYKNRIQLMKLDCNAQHNTSSTRPWIPMTRANALIVYSLLYIIWMSHYTKLSIFYWLLIPPLSEKRQTTELCPYINAAIPV